MPFLLMSKLKDYTDLYGFSGLFFEPALRDSATRSRGFVIPERWFADCKSSIRRRRITNPPERSWFEAHITKETKDETESKSE